MNLTLKKYDSLSFTERGVLFSINELWRESKLSVNAFGLRGVPDQRVVSVLTVAIGQAIGANKPSLKLLTEKMLADFFVWNGDAYMPSENNVSVLGVVRASSIRSNNAKGRRPSSSGFIYVFATKKSLVSGYSNVSQSECLPSLLKRHGRGVICHWEATASIKTSLAALEALIESGKFVANTQLVTPPSLPQPTSLPDEVCVAITAPIIAPILVLALQAPAVALPTELPQLPPIATPPASLPPEGQASFFGEPVELPIVKSKKSNKSDEKLTQPGEPVAYSESFDLFWHAWHATGCTRMGGKGDCFKRWKKAGAGVFIDVILQQIKYNVDIGNWKKEHAQFIPGPATFVNQRQWEGWTPSVNGAFIKHQKPSIKAVSNFDDKKEDGLF